MKLLQGVTFMNEDNKRRLAEWYGTRPGAGPVGYTDESERTADLSSQIPPRRPSGSSPTYREPFWSEDGQEGAPPRKKHFGARVAGICTRAHMQEILDRHEVEPSVQSRYFDGKLFYFEAGDTSRFLQVYQYTTSLGEILQKNLDAWYVDETNQLIFEDEAVLDQYNAAYFEMQRLLQDMGGSAVV